jgi:ABC-2 type transport system ATP-binding protein
VLRARVARIVGSVMVAGRGADRERGDVAVPVARPGEIVGVLGDNGAGKTSLLETIGAAHQESAGRARGRRSRGHALIRQSTEYAPELPVARVFAMWRRVLPEWDDARARAFCDDIGMPLDRPVWKLSRGMRSAIGMAIGLGSGAALVLFDEPFSGVDRSVIAAFGRHLRLLIAGGDVAAVVTAAHPESLRGLADRVLLLVDGRVVEDSPATDSFFDGVQF